MSNNYFLFLICRFHRGMPLRRGTKSSAKKTQVYFDFSVYTTATLPANTVTPLIPYRPPVIVQPDGTIYTHKPACGADCTSCIYSRLQEIILTIIQYVTDKVNLDSILTELMELRTEITSQQQAETILRRIESLILGIIDNITNRVNLRIVLQRITHLQGQLVIAGDTSSLYTEIYDLIIYIIDQIGSGTELAKVLETIQTLQYTLIPDQAVAAQIHEIEQMSLSIVDNVTNRINTTIILGRFVLLQRKINELLAITATGA